MFCGPRTLKGLMGVFLVEFFGP
uniref:Uncharacterized protein n=1 Tax=Anguilla anguilla TaxID=7936 RepID=A0A0E9U972_ANGAN